MSHSFDPTAILYLTAEIFFVAAVILALKFTEDGRVTVRLGADASPRQPRAIEVEDTGPGIPRGELDRILQAFEQVENGTDRRHGGTGLGLAITRALSERMGFRVEVVSELGRGSTFRVVMG